MIWLVYAMKSQNYLKEWHFHNIKQLYRISWCPETKSLIGLEMSHFVFKNQINNKIRTNLKSTGHRVLLDTSTLIDVDWALMMISWCDMIIGVQRYHSFLLEWEKLEMFVQSEIVKADLALIMKPLKIQFCSRRKKIIVRGAWHYFTS